MLYHLLAPLAKQHIIFNLFTYITFRAAGATVTALCLAFAVGPWVIARLRAGHVGQVIRAEGPASHHAKRGTPTMGGVIIIGATVVPTLLWARLDSRYVLVALGAILWMGALGFLDDFLKIVRGKSQGLVARWKLVGQITFGLALGLLLLAWPLAPNIQPVASTQVPLFKYWLLSFAPWAYVLFVTVVVTGSSNAVNLTDGLDGLATGLTAIVAAAFAIFAYLFGRFDAAHYLGVYYLPGAAELAVFCTALTGAALGFLWFNAHPAQVFMGDTGALAIGGALGTVAIVLKAEFLLLIAGGVFVAEAISVLVQTGAYRWYKRRRGKEYADAHRVFRMAPLHHHFEKLGWAEPQVVMRFYILGVLCAAIALATLKVR
ncbi:MAG TPA: phospho-N-acetylmuramoyl-pentapeptide-transferase [Gemmatimonadales bacterium]|nr:phospho-N-acetylmuramoyl-pentapeptide-transferase [Gemmatimonadales bacterium]